MDLKQFIEDTRRKLNSIERRLNRLSAAGGEANTASNVGAGGVGLFKQKLGVDLQFRNINAGSNKITVALDAPNNEVDIDVDFSKVMLDEIGDVNVPAPNDTEVLTWDDGAAEWVAAPGGGGGGGGAENPRAHRKVGQVYTTWDYFTYINFYLSSENLYAYPFIVPVSQDFDRIMVYVVTAAVNGVMRLGIYDDDGDLYPNNLIVSSAELDCSTIGYKSGVIAETLTAGLYWLVVNTDGDSNIRIVGMDYNGTTPIGYFAILGRPDNSFFTPAYTHWRLAEAYGALPDPFSGGASMVNNEDLGSIFLRKA